MGIEMKPTVFQGFQQATPTTAQKKEVAQPPTQFVPSKPPATHFQPSPTGFPKPTQAPVKQPTFTPAPTELFRKVATNPENAKIIGSFPTDAGKRALVMTTLLQTENEKIHNLCNLCMSCSSFLSADPVAGVESYYRDVVSELHKKPGILSRPKSVDDIVTEMMDVGPRCVGMLKKSFSDSVNWESKLKPEIETVKTLRPRLSDIMRCLNQEFGEKEYDEMIMGMIATIDNTVMMAEGQLDMLIVSKDRINTWQIVRIPAIMNVLSSPHLRKNRELFSASISQHTA